MTFRLSHSAKNILSMPLIATLVLFISACEMQTSSVGTGQLIDLGEPIPVALLIPKTSRNASSVAISLENATRLAMSQLDSAEINLKVYDTYGSSKIAATQAKLAVKKGAKIIIGPLFGDAANEVGLALSGQNVNVLSFSNNPTVAGGNLFIMGKTFENTAERLIKFAAAKGKRRAVIIYPDNVEGRLGRDALHAAAKKSKIRVVAIQSFSFTQESVVNSIPLVRAASKIYEADLLLLTSNSAGALPLLAQLLPEAGLNPQKIQYAGLARWDIPSQNVGLQGLQGGWFAVPETERYEIFSDHYFAEYQEKPHPLAGLAFDAISAIGALAQSGNFNALTTKALTRKSGFTGVDGIFRFTSSGTNQRGLAIAQINESQVTIIDDAPQSFNYSGM